MPAVHGIFGKPRAIDVMVALCACALSADDKIIRWVKPMLENISVEGCYTNKNIAKDRKIHVEESNKKARLLRQEHDVYAKNSETLFFDRIVRNSSVGTWSF